MRLTSLALGLSLSCSFLLGSCGGGGSNPASVSTPPGGGGTSGSSGTSSPLSSYTLTGDVSFVHDPSIIRQNSTYYVFSTDASATQGGFIPIRCSTDKISWSACGYVFSTLPAWTASAVPGATEIWAPDISYFNGVYHLYYAVSTFGSNVSAIGLVTTPTLDQTSASYKWTDQGQVLASSTTNSFNAIDPNILVDATGAVWLQYGSFWNGIYQQQIDPATGQVLTGGTIYHLAQRATTVANDPVEGASLVYEGGYYYLFVSWDYCCQTNPAQSNYKIVVGRGTTPNGPFLDQSGVDMAQGGGTILLQGNGTTWSAPGGQTAYIDAQNGDLIVFHALNLQQNGLDYLFVNSLAWQNGWPVIQP
jgi:arabinan endo-1,5-alpha-L-arabinosidase